MPRPFNAYLRVYEPLSAFGDPPDERLVAAVEQATMTRADSIAHEEHMWLKSQLTKPPRLLPAELADGKPAPSGLTDVLVLRPEDVPATKGVTVGPGPLVCPLELRPRSAAALTSFLDDSHPALRAAVLDANETNLEGARARAAAALGQVHSAALHVLSVSWTIPLPWFTLVNPEERRLNLGTGMDDPERELSWRVAMGDARRRVAKARELAESVLGDQGPTKVLVDTDRWLAAFDAQSAVELDYGGLVQLIADPLLESDTSAEEVHSILDALESGDVEELTDLFTGLRDYWSELAARERFN